MAVNFMKVVFYVVHVESTLTPSLILSYHLLPYLTLCSIPVPVSLPFSIFLFLLQKVPVQRTLRWEVPVWSSTATDL